MFDEVAPPRDVSQLRLPLIGRVDRDVSGAWRVFGPDGYEFEVRGTRMRLTGKVRAHADSLIGVTYRAVIADYRARRRR